jgi:hypothetical protein
MTQITIKTKAYAHNTNFNAIVDAILAAGYKERTQLQTHNDEMVGVLITTDAPSDFVEALTYTRSSVAVCA